MFDLPIYKVEKELGLAEKIKSSAKIISTSLLLPSEPFKIPEGLAKARGFIEQADLYYLKSVLASTGWNKNADVFDKIEAWVARHSPEDKAVNYQHVNDEIIGHMTDSFVTDFDGKIIAEDCAIDEIPSSFDIYDSAVLYRKWEKAELQERMDKLIAEIPDGKWCVSMECFFRNFDYAMRNKDGSSKVVARNDKTAFLTKHLRAYGGDGIYDGWEVGRLLRGIIFSGKGLVENPANPRSEIKEHSIARGEIFLPNTIFYDISEKPVYQTISKNIQEKMMTEAEFQKMVDSLKAENDSLKATLKENDTKEFKLKIEKLEASLKEKDEIGIKLNEDKVKLEASLTEARKSISDLTTKSTELEAVATKVQAELTEIKTKTEAEAEKNHREKFAAEKLNSGKVDEKVVKLVASTVKLDREGFEAHVVGMSEWVSTNPQSGNTTHPNSMTPKTPEQSTNMKKPSQSTNMAKSADLNDVETEKNAALAVETQNGVDKVRRSISEAFGAKFSE